VGGGPFSERRREGDGSVRGPGQEAWGGVLAGWGAGCSSSAPRPRSHLTSLKHLPCQHTYPLYNQHIKVCLSVLKIFSTLNLCSMMHISATCLCTALCTRRPLTKHARLAGVALCLLDHVSALPTLWQYWRGVRRGLPYIHAVSPRVQRNPSASAKVYGTRVRWDYVRGITGSSSTGNSVANSRNQASVWGRAPGA